MKLLPLTLSLSLLFSATSFAGPITSANLGVIGNSGSHTIDTNGTTDFDTELGLWDASGNLIAQNDDGGTGLDSLVTANLNAGQYYLGVSEYNSTFQNNFVNSNTGFEAGESGSFDINIDNEYVTTGIAGEHLTEETNFMEFFVLDFLELGNIGSAGNYTFDTNGTWNSFDTEIGIWDTFGNLLAQNDDGGTGLDSLINIDLTAGEYFIGVSEFNSVFADGFQNNASGFEDNESGSFRLNINDNFATSGIAGDHLYQETFFMNFSVTDVPEPSTFAIFALSIMGLASRRFKKQS